MTNQFPKFRAWVKSESGEGWFMSYPRWIDIENKRICTESGLQPKDFILMPYTGMTDEYGAKAYQYDVVSAMGYPNWAIEWHNNGWMLNQMESDNYKDIPEDGFVIIGNIFTIIGNNSEIYEEVING